MEPPFRRSTIALMLLGLVGLAAGPGFERVIGPETSMADTNDVVGALGDRAAAHRDGLRLTDEERAQVFDGVMRMADVPVADVEPPETAATLPGWVALENLPAGVSLQIPRVDGYKFVKL